MADTKITALTALTAADPANDVLPIVDVSDTTMAASGTTKKISVNNILGCSGTATLASATITGDLTVDTSTLKVDSANDRVGVGTTTPSQKLEVATLGSDTRVRINSTSVVCTEYFRSGTGLWLVGSDSTNAFKIARGSNFGGSADYFAIAAATADCTWYDGAGGTRMTLNSTGLGVGGSPTAKISCAGYSSANQLPDINIARSSSGTAIQTGPNIVFADGTSNNTVTLQNSQGRFGIWNYGVGAWNERLSVDASGNVGIGVTPTNVAGYRKLELGGTSSSALLLNTNSSNAAARNWATASNFNAFGDYVFLQSNALGGDPVSAGTARMTLDASGNLLVGTTASGGQNGFCVLRPLSAGVVATTAETAHNFGALTGTTYATFLYATTVIGSITQNGTTGVLYNITSDYRLKESVQPLVGGLARVNALKPSVYRWKSDGSNGEGFLAHELAEVVPFAVSGEKDAVNEDGSIKSQGIDMSRVVPILVAAIQELTARVQTLETR